jgi:hypothetical protein
VDLDSLGIDCDALNICVEAETWAEVDVDYDQTVVENLHVKTWTAYPAPFVPADTEIDVTEMVRLGAEREVLEVFENEMVKELEYRSSRREAFEEDRERLFPTD